MNRSRLALVVLVVAACFGAAAPAHAKDLSNRFGLGMSTAFANRGMAGPAIPMTGINLPATPSLSMRYNINEKVVLNPGFGLVYRTAEGANSEYTAGIRILGNLVQESNMNFYIGGGPVVTFRTGDPSDTTLGKIIRLPATFGVEFFFTRLPNLGFAAEAGFELSYFMPDAMDQKSETTISTVGGIFNVGLHYYFAAGGGDEGGGSDQQQ